MTLYLFFLNKNTKKMAFLHILDLQSKNYNTILKKQLLKKMVFNNRFSNSIKISNFKYFFFIKLVLGWD